MIVGGFWEVGWGPGAMGRVGVPRAATGGGWEGSPWGAILQLWDAWLGGSWLMWGDPG